MPTYYIQHHRVYRLYDVYVVIVQACNYNVIV